MIEYPKIETLFDRNPEDMKHVIYNQYRLEEFNVLRGAPIWHITEKIDGTNIRVMWDGGINVSVAGRTDNAQMAPKLVEMLQDQFPVDAFCEAFDLDDSGNYPEVTLYGEAYGPKIQSGGWYRDNFGIRLFDVRVGEWWLNWDDVQDVAWKLNASTVPVLLRGATIWDALDLVAHPSVTANIESGLTERTHEGIVARTEPILLRRNGERLMWKLKVRDLAAEYKALREALV